MIWGAFFTEYLFLGLFALFNLNDDQIARLWLPNSLPVLKWVLRLARNDNPFGSNVLAILL